MKKEFTMSSPRSSLGNVRSDMDITYPEPLSRLHHHSLLFDYSKSQRSQKKNVSNRRGHRYRTQPVTFDEILEMDEDTTQEEMQLVNKKDRQMIELLCKSKAKGLPTTQYHTQLDTKIATTTESSKVLEEMCCSESNAFNIQKEQKNRLNKARKGSI